MHNFDHYYRCQRGGAYYSNYPDNEIRPEFTVMVDLQRAHSLLFMTDSVQRLSYSCCKGLFYTVSQKTSHL